MMSSGKSIVYQWLLSVCLLQSWVLPAAAESFDCLIEPMQTVSLSSPVTGLLEKVLVSRGDRIRKGQVLAALESDAEQAAAELARYKSTLAGPARLAENKIGFGERKFHRKKEMAAENLAPLQESDDAEAELQQARAELQVAKENLQVANLEFKQQNSMLRLRTITSPFDGVVVEQMIYPGEVVEPGGEKRAILKVAQLHPLRVRVILPSRYFGRISTGMLADIAPEIPLSTQLQGKVRIIDRLVDAASGTFVVFLDLPNPQASIPSGLKCTASFKLASAPAPATTGPSKRAR